MDRSSLVPEVTVKALFTGDGSLSIGLAVPVHAQVVKEQCLNYIIHESLGMSSVSFQASRFPSGTKTDRHGESGRSHFVGY